MLTSYRLLLVAMSAGLESGQLFLSSCWILKLPCEVFIIWFLQCYKSYVAKTYQMHFLPLKTFAKQFFVNLWKLALFFFSFALSSIVGTLLFFFCFFLLCITLPSCQCAAMYITLIRHVHYVTDALDVQVCLCARAGRARLSH